MSKGVYIYIYSIVMVGPGVVYMYVTTARTGEVIAGGDAGV